MRISLFLLLLLTFSPGFVAQTYSFDHYSVQEGLSQSNVEGILQDKNGYLWIGTGSGLSRFDGKNFRNYSSSDGLAEDRISCMMMDADNTLWLGHPNGSITCYNGKGLRQVKTPYTFSGKNIRSIFQDKQKRIWISVIPQGVFMLKDSKSASDTNAFKNFRSKDGLSENVFSVFQLKNGSMGFITDIGVKTMVSDNKFEFLKIQGMPPAQTTCFLEDIKGNYWIGTYNSGLVYYDTQHKQCTLYNSVNGFPHNFISTLHEENDGKIWAGTWGGGAVLISNGEIKKISIASGLNSNKISHFFKDREGNMILGTYGAGFSVFKGEKFISMTADNGLVSNQVNAITKDKEGNMWFGTAAGISVYNTKEKTIRNIESANGISLNQVSVLKKDNNGNIWIGLWGNGIVKYDAGSSRFVTVPSLSHDVYAYISSIDMDKNGSLWFGTIDGAVRYDLLSGTTQSYRTVDGLAGNDIQVIYCDSKGRTWFGCNERGLSIYDGNKFKNFSRKDGFTNNNPSSICEDKNGNIWIGTSGGGIYIYNGQSFLNRRVKDGLASDFATLIVAGNRNNIFIGSNKGLSKYDADTKQFYNFGKYDGFGALETRPKAVYKDTENKTWFGTVHGAVLYNAEFDTKNSLEPIINLSSVRVNYKDIIPSPGLELDYKENSIAFEFIAVCISNPEEVRYEYMLEGFNKTPRPVTKNNSVDYTNLPPGEYTFSVKASNNSGVWTKVPLQFSFYIQPPFWQRWWFYVSCIVVIISGFFTYVKIRERNLVKEKRVLEEKVQVRTAEVVQKNIELDEKNRDITASIRYAKRIQDAILPPDKLVQSILPNTFILFKPKDIVSGDFYWTANVGNKVLFAAVDCTGHGVPGAFMSIVGHNMLEQIVKQHGVTEPAEVLNALNKSVSDTLRQSHLEDNAVKDGMDITLCCFNYDTNELQYAGAFNPLYFIRNGELKETKADKFPIGNLKPGEQKKFTNHSITMQKGDTVYIFSDGYADQFGGPDGKKLKYGTFKKILLDINTMSMNEQKTFLDKSIEEWKGQLEQVDDILVIGTRL